jgi:hypothetical protein
LITDEKSSCTPSSMAVLHRTIAAFGENALYTVLKGRQTLHEYDVEFGKNSLQVGPDITGKPDILPNKEPKQGIQGKQKRDARSS